MNYKISDRLELDISKRSPVPTLSPLLLSEFCPVTESDSLMVIHDCPLKTSPLDFMPTSLIKNCSDVFASLILRLSSTAGDFPDIFKVGQITPLIKKPGSDVSELSNYH